VGWRGPCRPCCHSASGFAAGRGRHSHWIGLAVVLRIVGKDPAGWGLGRRSQSLAGHHTGMGPVGWGLAGWDLDHRSLGPVRLANLHIERGPAGWGLVDRSLGLGRRIVAVVHRLETFYF